MIRRTEWAAIRVADYKAAVLGGAQAGLRDVIGRTNLAQLLSDRQSIDDYLAKTLDAQTEPWGALHLRSDHRIDDDATGSSDKSEP